MGFLRNSTVKVSRKGNELVAVFYGASPPLSWHYDLAKNTDFTLTVQPNEKSGWQLGVATATGGFTPVAQFLAQDDAEDAFKKTNSVLMRSKYDFLWRVLAGIGIAAFLFLLMLMYLGRDAAHLAMTGGTPVAPMPSSNLGVPQAADDVLTPPSR